MRSGKKSLRMSEKAVLIKMAMKEDGISGDVRDYVLMAGSEITTIHASYTATSKLDGREVDPSNIAGDGDIDPHLERKVIHRSNLWKYIGQSEARNFWKFGRRTRR